jgi:predicted RNA binding protein YcfA (HicA-like mRNA interferase family)
VPKKYREVKKILSRAGWRVIRTTGSHQVWRHEDGRQVVVPGGGKNSAGVPIGILVDIRKRTGLEELR